MTKSKDNKRAASCTKTDVPSTKNRRHSHHIEKVGRYEVKKKIGSGAMGDVYLGWDPYIKRPVAIKTSRLATEKARTGFFVEAQSAGRLNHPYIITVYDVGEDNELSYIAMEYVEGNTLNTYCQKSTLLPPQKAINLVIQLCEGLAYAHSQKVIHRDIKPANIVLCPDDTPKIMDFGIALITQKIKQSRIAGTPYYMSPEQIQGKPLQSVSDIFSLGCVLYELLSGKKPFQGSNFAQIRNQIVHHTPSPLLPDRPHLPELIDQIIQKAMAKNPIGRYHSCLEMANDLKTAIRRMPDEIAFDTTDNIIKFLYQIKFFREFSEDQLNLMLAASKITSVQAGRVIFAEGDIDDTIYIILSGKVSIIDKNDDFVGFLNSGELFGELAFLGNQVRRASVMAEVNCVLMETSAMVIDSLPESIKLLFYKNFALSLIQRFAPV